MLDNNCLTHCLNCSTLILLSCCMQILGLMSMGAVIPTSNIISQLSSQTIAYSILFLKRTSPLDLLSLYNSPYRAISSQLVTASIRVAKRHESWLGLFRGTAARNNPSPYSRPLVPRPAKISKAPCRLCTLSRLFFCRALNCVATL